MRMELLVNDYANVRVTFRAQKEITQTLCTT